MSLKIKIYSAMPAVVKEAMTRVYMALRSRRELAAAKRLSGTSSGDSVKVVYISGFPRSGTTVLKYYFAAHQGLEQSPFSPVGFFDVWDRAREKSAIQVDKSNHYISALQTLFAGCGRGARLVIVIRDPRDCLVSFAKYEENREVPRDRRFWRYWVDQHAELFRFASESEFADCLFLVRYEDLVRFPEAAKAAYLQWLGFDVDASVLDRNYRNEHPEEGWHDSVHDFKEVGSHALQKWASAEDLPAWCSERLREWEDDGEVRAMMRTFGYTADGFGKPALEPTRFAFFRAPDA